MNTPHTRQIGFWSGMVLVLLGLIYLGLVLAMLISGSGFPPLEPFQTMINIVVLITAAWMVFFWVVLNQVAPSDKKLFFQASLAMIVIFATLTSINRYVGLTVVKQSVASGNTSGLQWFMPYGWPSAMLAVEYLGWGFYFGLACFSLAPGFVNGRLERAIFWTLLATGLLSLLSVIGQVLGSNSQAFSLFTMAGVLGWGPGLTVATLLMAIWIRRKR